MEELYNTLTKVIKGLTLKKYWTEEDQITANAIMKFKRYIENECKRLQEQKNNS